MKLVYKFSALLLASGILTACQKDKENPTVNILEPVDMEELHWGDEMHVEASFADDQDLKSYHIYLGNEAGDAVTDFEVNFTADISGKTYEFHEHVIVPDSITAEYYLYFEVTDAEGKTASDKVKLHFMQ